MYSLIFLSLFLSQVIYPFFRLFYFPYNVLLSFFLICYIFLFHFYDVLFFPISFIYFYLSSVTFQFFFTRISLFQNFYFANERTSLSNIPLLQFPAREHTQIHTSTQILKLTNSYKEIKPLSSLAFSQPVLPHSEGQIHHILSLSNHGSPK